MNQSQKENTKLTEEGFEFIGTDGKIYKCAMWGDAPWIFYKHPDGQWVSLKQINQMGVWAAYEQRVNQEPSIGPLKTSQNEDKPMTSKEYLKKTPGVFEVLAQLDGGDCQRAKQMPDFLNKAMDLLDECRLQLEYLDKRFPTGTTPNILSRITTFQQSLANGREAGGK